LALHQHPNGWHRRQARLILQQRAAGGESMQQVAQSLRSMIARSDDVLAVRAMMTMLAIGQLDETFALAQLAHPHESVRVWAIRGLSDRWPLDDCYGPVRTVERIEPQVMR